MASILRLIAIITAALLVFGWSSTTAETLNAEFQLETRARSFRIETFRYFRNNRTVYDRRVRGSEGLIDRWRDRGASEQEARDLIDWFARATLATQQQVGLPALPALRTQMFELAESPSHPIAPTNTGVVLESMPDIESIKRDRMLSDRLANSMEPASQTDGGSGPLPVSNLEQLPTPISLKQDSAVDSRDPVRPLPPVLSAQPRDRQTVPPTDRTPNENELEALAVELIVAPETESIDPPHTTSVQTVEVASEQSASVDHELLADRIAEHNRSMRIVENHLRRETSWTLRQLEDVGTRINEILQRHDVWRMYWGLLDASDQDALGHIATPDRCFGLFQQRLFEVQVSSEEESSLASATRRERRFQKLEEGIQKWQSR